MRVIVTGAIRGAFAGGTLEGRPVGGMAAIAALTDSLERACGCPTFWVDAGGASHGAPVPALARGALTVAAFNAAGVAAATAGAGDLAVMGDELGARLAASRFPWLGLNATTPAPGAGLRPWVRLERGGRAVVVLGLVDGTAPGAAGRSVAGVRVTDPAAAITRALGGVRAERPDAVLALGDFDAGCATPGCGGEAIGIAHALDSGVVHAIVGGTAAQRVRGTVVAPTLAYGIGVTVVDVVELADGGVAARARVDTVWADRVTPDSAIAGLIAEDLEALERALDESVATLRFALPGEGDGEVPVGRLVADAVRGAGRTTIGIIPSSTVRFGLPGGTVSLRHLYERFPFPSPLVTVAVSGEKLEGILEVALAEEPLAIQVSGITARYEARRRPGQRVRDLRLTDGDRVERGRTYRVTLPTTLLDLEAFAPLRDAPTEAVGVTDRQALRRYLGLVRQPVDAPATDRVVIVR